MLAELVKQPLRCAVRQWTTY